jgi:RNA polymerase sigma factor (sigma-70 family)
VEDVHIIDLYWQRNERAIQETNTKYGPYCFTVAKRILCNREDSEECVNDTWIKAWNSIPPQRPNFLRMFLTRITRNLAFDVLTHRNAAKRGSGVVAIAFDELEDCVASTADVETECQLNELTVSINRFLHLLPRRECDIFLRRYFFMESISEIANRYGMKESNAYVVLSRTRAKLKRHIAREGYDT